MSHTIGPWRVERQNPSPTTGEWMIAGGKPGYLAEMRDCGSGDVAANARLIAAAPELLDALYSALPYVEEGEEFNHPDKRNLSKTIRALIAKATGGAA